MKASLDGSDEGHARRPTLVVYFPLGDPEIPIDGLDVYAERGVDFVEFGWPAREPYLDGPDVSASMARASLGDPRAALAGALSRLAAHAHAPKALLMTYGEASHPGLEDVSFFHGLDALLVVGSPTDPLRLTLEARARQAGVAISVFLPLPLTEADIAAARDADGYVMLQAAPGVTGPRATLDPGNRERIALLRVAGVRAPIILGFGLSEGAQARAAVELGADGVVVGSAALRAGRRGLSELETLLRDLRNDLDD